jgi:hypothetical protein
VDVLSASSTTVACRLCLSTRRLRHRSLDADRDGGLLPDVDSRRGGPSAGVEVVCGDGGGGGEGGRRWGAEAQHVHVRHERPLVHGPHGAHPQVHDGHGAAVVGAGCGRGRRQQRLRGRALRVGDLLGVEDGEGGERVDDGGAVVWLRGDGVAHEGELAEGCGVGH